MSPQEGTANSNAANEALVADGAAAPDVDAVGPVLSVRNVQKIFGSRDSLTYALSGISFDVQAGEFVGVMGPSGSGKTTLLNCIAAIDDMTGGSISVAGCDIVGASRRRLAKYRREQLGFIFQDANLIDTLTGLENIALALTIKGEPHKNIPGKVNAMAARLGVADVLGKYPHQMSGGQRQRIAAARAVVGDPALVLADEPTGALDSRAASVMLETLDTLNTQMSATILMVTHDAFAASFTHRVLFVKDGRLLNELRRGTDTRQQFFGRIIEVVSFLGGEAKRPQPAGAQGEARGDSIVPCGSGGEACRGSRERKSGEASHAV